MATWWPKTLFNKTMSTNENNDGDSESFRDSIATIDNEGKRKWIFPQKPFGKLYQLRNWFTLIYLIVFFSLPFIKLNGDPLFLLNVPEKKFILFGAIFWPQDFFIFGLGMLLFIFFIILFTVVFGRLFCGWACPQTVFMEMVFRKIEYWIEGDATHQKALKNRKWDLFKLKKRGTKFTLFFIFSFLIAATMLSYIIGLNSVIEIIQNPFGVKKTAFSSLLLFTAVFFFVFWWFREQACIIVCPYGRLQGVLLDKNSIVVAYDYVRGEKRHHFKKNETRIGGDCIDCRLCVKVCPTGIDIRNGTQLECTNCTACIDVCNHMMENVGLPKNLIRYDSENGIRKKEKLRFTPRMKAYSVVLLLLIGIEASLLITRSDYDATILRAKGLLYQEKENNQISNIYTIKLVNKTRKQLPVELRIENYPAKIEWVGKNLEVKPEGITESEFFVIVNKHELIDRKTKLEIGVYSNGKRIKIIKTNFLGPFKNSPL